MYSESIDSNDAEVIRKAQKPIERAHTKMIIEMAKIAIDRAREIMDGKRNE